MYTERIKDIFAPPIAAELVEIDDVDRQILEVLRDDGRTSYAEIARRMNFSASAVRGRARRLMNHGVVRATALVTPGLVGLQHMLGVGIRLRGEGERDTVNEIALMKSVSYLSLTLGRWDAIATLLVQTQAELVSELDRLRSMPGVESLESWTHLEVMKVDHSLS
jgi:DNA-binding Lrp family transcriptional regulator